MGLLQTSDPSIGVGTGVETSATKVFTETAASSNVVDELLEALGPKRREHSRSTAKVAAGLCTRFGLDAEKGRLAGLLHDSMKEREVKEQWELAEQGRNAMNDKLISRAVQEFREGEDFGSKMIHGPAAAGYLYCCAGWTDMEVLEAIALHSSAFEAMGPLCKVLYVADKLEPLREYVGRAEAKALETEDLDSLFTYAVGHVVEYLKGKNYHIAQSTLDLYNSFTTKKAYA